MPQNLLVPFDGSPLSKRALEYAFDEYDDVSVVVLHVIDPTDPGYSSVIDVDVRNEPLHGSKDWYDRAHEVEAQLFDEARELAADADGEITTESAVGDPAREIVDYAEANDIDEIVIGSHGRSETSRTLLGSVAELVVRRSPVSVSVVRGPET
ncbi:universal stress protein [Haloarchaeobius amylolyticus]|uniref:Universal stress protein n=1 Tax=Haloarchaeobius amylolyticus TaxID=1198296 RepID=A0ABD6BB98_9EURY